MIKTFYIVKHLQNRKDHYSWVFQFIIKTVKGSIDNLHFLDMGLHMYRSKWYILGTYPLNWNPLSCAPLYKPQLLTAPSHLLPCLPLKTLTKTDQNIYHNDNILFDHNVQIKIKIYNSLENLIMNWSGDKKVFSLCYKIVFVFIRKLPLVYIEISS